MSDRDIERVRQVARVVITGQIGAIEAAWMLSPLMHSHQDVASQEDRNLFIGIQSETDDLPIGKLRNNWHPDFLSEKDHEIVRYESLYRRPVNEACQRILARLQARV